MALFCRAEHQSLVHAEKEGPVGQRRSRLETDEMNVLPQAVGLCLCLSQARLQLLLGHLEVANVSGRWG